MLSRTLNVSFFRIGLVGGRLRSSTSDALRDNPAEELPTRAKESRATVWRSEIGGGVEVDGDSCFANVCKMVRVCACMYVGVWVCVREMERGKWGKI